MLDKIDLKAKKLSKEEYKPAHDELVEKLIVLQQEARTKGVGLVVLVEGWAGAGKGSRISDLVYHLDARATSVHDTGDVNVQSAHDFAGTEWGVTGMQPLFQEFWAALGERGTFTFYDRGWYTAAAEQVLFNLVGDEAEPVKKLAKKVKKGQLLSDVSAAKTRGELRGDPVSGYRRMAHDFERMLVDDGYVVVKFFVHISKKAQKKRLEALHDDPETAWRVSDAKLGLTKYYDKAYELYDKLLEGSNFEFAPWTVVNGEDKRAANVQIASTLVEALEGALAAGPDAAAEEAKAKAAENSARAAAAAEGGAEQAPDSAALLKEYEQQAKLQKKQAPKESKFIIMSGYPQIDHSKTKPSIDSEDEYHDKLKAEQERFRKLENRMLPEDLDYPAIRGLRIEAAQKLAAIRPASIGQASRISGVSPADIAVLLVYLKQNKG